MSFYKRENETLFIAPIFVLNTNVNLTVDNHTEHTYPVDGWYWFDTLDEAMVALGSPPPPPTISHVSPRQIRQALSAAGLRESVEAAVQAGDQNLKDWWLFSTFFERDNAEVNAMGIALGVSVEQLDALWLLAATL